MARQLGLRWGTCAFALGSVLIACGGSDAVSHGDGNGGDSSTPLADDGGAREGGSSGSHARGDGGGGSTTSAGGPCDDFVCGEGLACVVVDGQALCEGSCKGVACAEGRACEVQSGVGRCVAVCEPACGSGQRCEVDGGGEGACVDNTCGDLTCGASEACAAAQDGPGYLCVDNTCDDDLDCPEAQHCDPDDGLCMGDVCKPGVRRCDGEVVMECEANGADETARMTCQGVAGYESTCVEQGGQGACSCRGDWDCPAYTACVVGRCEGTGRAASCFVQPLPFEAVLPTAEPGFPWGGHDGDGYDAGNALYTGAVPSRWAWGSPFPEHAQVSAAPVVANLDDDNGDGLINELDFPEILFTSFCQQNYFDNGVLRALHGGGATPGSHKFAVCGDTLWKEGDPVFEEGTEDLVAGASCPCSAGALEPTGGLAVGDLDGDGVPEIAVLGDGGNDALHLYANTGERISVNAVTAVPGSDPAVAIANVDGEGMAEVVVGRALYILGRDVNDKLVVSHELVGAESTGVNNGQGASSCVADLDGDGRMEIIAGGTAYRVPQAYDGDCPPDTGPLSGDDKLYCDGLLDVLWDHGAEGFCAIADVLGALPAQPGIDPEIPPGPDHDLDGVPEVLLITGGHLLVLDGLSGLERLDVVLDNRDGGPPNVDDFDGDGFPEVATAFDTKYVVHDFQASTDDGGPAGSCASWPHSLDGDPDSADPLGEGAGNLPRTPPELGCVTHADCGDTSAFACGTDGSCVCLHNGWSSTTQDASSRVTGSSVFDFNGDGRAEVVYNDECYFRIYEGLTGRTYQRLKSQSPTRIEYPVVADVDNDGNAEVVFSSSNARSESCPGEGSGQYANGLNVIGEPEDRWVSARRMWNQHSYHVTNVLEGGGVPEREPDGWRAFNGRRYNTYRSNLPPVGNVAPDLVVSGVQVSSPDVACGQALSDTIRITARIENQGDLRVGPGVVVDFFGDDALLGSEALETSLEPGAELFVGHLHTAASAAALPDTVRVVVDAQGDPVFGTERECHEDNNEGSASVVAGEAIADLNVQVALLDGDCPDRSLRVQVFNDGAADVDGVVLRLFAGNPSAGGETLGNDVMLGAIPAGGDSGHVDVDVNLQNRSATVFVVVDPDDAIMECDESNNAGAVPVACGSVELN